MKKFFIILLALLLAAASGFFVSSVVAPFTSERVSDALPEAMNSDDAPSIDNASDTAMMAALALDDSATTSSAGSSMMASTAPVQPLPPAVYARYIDGVIGAGRPLVLFLRRTNSIDATDAEQNLRALYAEHRPTVSTYLVDERTNPTVWQQFATTSIDGAPPMFVFVDARGTVVDQRPALSRTDLQQFLSR